MPGSWPPTCSARPTGYAPRTASGSALRSAPAVTAPRPAFAEPVPAPANRVTSPIQESGLRPKSAAGSPARAFGPHSPTAARPRRTCSSTQPRSPRPPPMPGSSTSAWPPSPGLPPTPAPSTAVCSPGPPASAPWPAAGFAFRPVLAATAPQPASVAPVPAPAYCAIRPTRWSGFPLRSAAWLPEPIAPGSALALRSSPATAARPRHSCLSAWRPLPGPPPTPGSLTPVRCPRRPASSASRSVAGFAFRRAPAATVPRPAGAAPPRPGPRRALP